MKNRIRTGDMVKIIVGKDKGRSGRVKHMLLKDNKLIVEGLNVVKCFNKRKLMAGVNTKEMPIHLSNVSHIDPDTGLATKTSIVKKDLKKLLISKKSGKIIREISTKQEFSNV